MRDAATALGVDPYQWILAGGDDHALAATFPPGVPLPPGVAGDRQRARGHRRHRRPQAVDRAAPGWDHFR